MTTRTEIKEQIAQLQARLAEMETNELQQAYEPSEEPKCVIKVKDCQGGKSNDVIVAPSFVSVKAGRLVVIILPSRIALERQLTGRLQEGVIEESIDDIVGLNTIQRDILKEDDTVLKENEIGRFDGGIKIKDGRLTTTKTTLPKIRNNNIKVLIVLNNPQGMKKLISIISSFNHTDKPIDFIVDEAHGVFNIKLDNNEYLQTRFQNQNMTIQNIISNGLLPEAKDIFLENGERIAWILNKIQNNQRWSITGTTATTSYIAQNEYLRNTDILFPVQIMNTPSCYKGFSSLNRKLYSQTLGIGDAFDKIIKQDKSKGGTIVMCHVGRKNSQHHEAGRKWGKICRENGLKKKQIAIITDNQNGYTFYDYKMRVKQVFPKNGIFNEPWQVVHRIQQERPFIGIFGDTSMSESNSYQKCTKDVNCFIGHMIVMSFKYQMKDMTKLIQKIERICCNNTSGQENLQHLWTPEGSERIQQNIYTKIINAKALEKAIQKEAEGTSLTRVRYKRLERLAIKGRLTINGELTEEEKDRRNRNSESLEEEPETVLEGIIIILRENNESMTGAEICEEMNEREWFQTYQGLKAQIIHNLTHINTRDNFQQDRSNGAAIYSLKN